MFKQIFRLAFVTVIWKQYKQIIVSTTLLFIYLWLVGSVHADYMSYAEIQSDDARIGQSFLYKWAALIGGVLLYIAYNFFRGSQENTQQAKSSKPNGSNSIPSKEQSADDPFAEIRVKEKLRTRAEILVDKNKD